VEADVEQLASGSRKGQVEVGVQVQVKVKGHSHGHGEGIRQISNGETGEVGVVKCWSELLPENPPLQLLGRILPVPDVGQGRRVRCGQRKRAQHARTQLSTGRTRPSSTGAFPEILNGCQRRGRC
jgi:hypothetical protein